MQGRPRGPTMLPRTGRPVGSVQAACAIQLRRHGAKGVTAAPTGADSKCMGCCPWLRPLAAGKLSSRHSPLACGAGADAGIRCAVDGAAENVLCEADVIGDNCRQGEVAGSEGKAEEWARAGTASQWVRPALACPPSCLQGGPPLRAHIAAALAGWGAGLEAPPLACCCEVGLHALAGLQDVPHVVVAILGHHLRGRGLGGGGKLCFYPLNAGLGDEFSAD